MFHSSLRAKIDIFVAGTRKKLSSSTLEEYANHFYEMDEDGNTFLHQLIKDHAPQERYMKAAFLLFKSLDERRRRLVLDTITEDEHTIIGYLLLNELAYWYAFDYMNIDPFRPLYRVERVRLERSLDLLIKKNYLETCMALRSIHQISLTEKCYRGGYTPIEIAIQHGKQEFIEYLLREGVKLNLPQDSNERYPIFQAKDYEMLVYLHEKCHARLNVQDQSGKTLYDLVATWKTSPFRAFAYLFRQGVYPAIQMKSFNPPKEYRFTSLALLKAYRKPFQLFPLFRLLPEDHVQSLFRFMTVSIEKIEEWYYMTNDSHGHYFFNRLHETKGKIFSLTHPATGSTYLQQCIEEDDSKTFKEILDIKQYPPDEVDCIKEECLQTFDMMNRKGETILMTACKTSFRSTYQFLPAILKWLHRPLLPQEKKALAENLYKLIREDEAEDVIPRLHEMGVDLNACMDEEKVNPLLVAAHYQLSSIILLLQECGVDLNQRYAHGQTFIMMNAGQPPDHIEEMGLDLNLQDDEGQTVLHHLGKMRQSYCYSIYLDAGADPTILDHAGKTTLDYFRESYANECGTELDVFERLLERLHGSHISHVAPLPSPTERLPLPGN